MNIDESRRCWVTIDLNRNFAIVSFENDFSRNGNCKRKDSGIYTKIDENSRSLVILFNPFNRFDVPVFNVSRIVSPKSGILLNDIVSTSIFLNRIDRYC